MYTLKRNAQGLRAEGEAVCELKVVFLPAIAQCWPVRCSAKIPPIITTNLAIAIFIETLARYARLIARGKASWRACGPRKTHASEERTHHSHDSECWCTTPFTSASLGWKVAAEAIMAGRGEFAFDDDSRYDSAEEDAFYQESYAASNERGSPLVPVLEDVMSKVPLLDACQSARAAELTACVDTQLSRGIFTSWQKRWIRVTPDAVYRFSVSPLLLTVMCGARLCS